MRSFAAILMVASLVSIGAFVPFASAPPEARGSTAPADIAVEPRPQTPGVVVEADDVFVSGIAGASVSDQSRVADSRGGSGPVGLLELVRAALVIAEHTAVGDQRFLQTPPPAADPVTP